MLVSESASDEAQNILLVRSSLSFGNAAFHLFTDGFDRRAVTSRLA